MTALPRVAVITPVYNGETFLREAMASVQAQSYPNLVHVVLNNASTDATSAIIEEFRDGRVPVIVVRNDITLPLGDNWNKAVALGSRDANYFRILCADDAILNDGIAKMVALAETDPAINVVASLRRTTYGLEEFGWDKTRTVFDGKEAIHACFVGGNGFPSPHVLYRTSRDAIRDPFFDTSLLSFDTEAILHALSQEGAKLGFVHEPLGFTRRHAESVTATAAAPKHTVYFDWAAMMRRYAPLALCPDEFARVSKAFRRHYVRRLVAWRYVDANRKAFDWHTKELRAQGLGLTAADYIDALFDYALCKAGMRKGWAQYPQG